MIQMAPEHSHLFGSSYDIPRLCPSIWVTMTENASSVISLGYYIKKKIQMKENSLRVVNNSTFLILNIFLIL